MFVPDGAAPGAVERRRLRRSVRPRRGAWLTPRRSAPRSAAGAPPRRRRSAGAGRSRWRPRTSRGAARQAVRRSAERCDRGRRGAGRARELSLGRASEALHHHRHGHRPGQDQQRQCAGADGRVHRQRARRRSAPRVSGRRSRRSRSGLLAGRRVGALYRPLKHAAGACLARRRTARCSSNSATGCRPAAYPLAGEIARGGRAARGRHRARSAPACSTARRSASSRCSVRTPRNFSISCTSARCRRLQPGQARYGLLLNENGIVVDDGIVARLGRAALLGQHHERRRRAHGGGVRGVAAVRVHDLQGARDAGHLALGQCHGGRAARLGVARVRSGFDAALAPGVDAAHDAAREHAGMGCRCACCARASAASSATRSTCPPITRSALLERLWARAGEIRRGALRHRGAGDHAHREGLSSTSAPTPTAPRCRRISGSRAASSARPRISSAAARWRGRRRATPERLQLVG